MNWLRTGRRAGRRLFVLGTVVFMVTLLAPAAAVPVPVSAADPSSETSGDGVSVHIDQSSLESDVGTELTILVTVIGCPGVAPVATVANSGGARPLDLKDN